jgi:hypothetical protein
MRRPPASHGPGILGRGSFGFRRPKAGRLYSPRPIALATYAREANNHDAERKCIEIRVRAERKVGESLATIEKAKGGGEPGVGRSGKNALARNEGIPSPKTLADYGLTYDQSSQFASARSGRSASCWQQPRKRRHQPPLPFQEPRVSNGPRILRGPLRPSPTTAFT